MSSEYGLLGSVQLNGDPDAWWNEFDLTGWPVWGGRTVRGSPGLVVPHADGQLATDVHLDAVKVTSLGVVFGDRDQSGSPVASFSAIRQQLKTNVDVLNALVKQRITATYHLYGNTYTADVTVLSCRQESGNPLSTTQTGPTALAVALELWFPAGEMTLTGS